MYENPHKNNGYVTAMRAAALSGDSWAQFDLGLAYLNGDGVPQDTVTAILWFQKASAQGHIGAWQRLQTTHCD